MGDHFDENEKKSARRRHCSKIFKKILKLIYLHFLIAPRGARGVKRTGKTKIRFAANFQPNLKKIQKITKKPAYFDDFC
jgi:hypothetical protein